MPLAGNEIAIPEDVKAVHFKVEVRYDNIIIYIHLMEKIYNKIPLCI